MMRYLSEEEEVKYAQFGRDIIEAYKSLTEPYMVFNEIEEDFRPMAYYWMRGVLMAIQLLKRNNIGKFRYVETDYLKCFLPTHKEQYDTCIMESLEEIIAYCQYKYSLNKEECKLYSTSTQIQYTDLMKIPTNIIEDEKGHIVASDGIMGRLFLINDKIIGINTSSSNKGFFLKEIENEYGDDIRTINDEFFHWSDIIY